MEAVIFFILSFILILYCSDFIVSDQVGSLQAFLIWKTDSIFSPTILLTIIELWFIEVLNHSTEVACQAPNLWTQVPNLLDRLLIFGIC